MAHILRQPKLKPALIKLCLPIQTQGFQLTFISQRPKKYYQPVDSSKWTPPSQFLTQNRLCTSIDTNKNHGPSWLEPYLQVTRFRSQIGSLLLFWPCSWSITMASDSITWPYLEVLSLFGIGSFLMRGAGCIVNDYLDRKFDRQVKRTKSRPFASRLVTRKEGITFMSIHLALASLILFHFNWYTVALGLGAFCTAMTYPLMKRVINWPQMYLGGSFSFGVLMGWSAVQGHCMWSVCLPLYVASVTWTVFYDTIYAYQDYKCDKEVGVLSSAVRIGDHPKPWLAGFAVLMQSCFIATGIAAGMEWPYYISLLLTGAHLANQITTLNINDTQDCGKKFASNNQIGYIILAGIFGSMYVKHKNKSSQTEDSTVMLDEI